MNDSVQSSDDRGLWVLALGVAGPIISCVFYLTNSIERICPDFICFWTAATIISTGGNPYDPALQADVQAGLGWSKAVNGLGFYDFMPYYYPPWFGAALVPFLPLGYRVAKVAWLVINFECLMIAGLLLRSMVRAELRFVPAFLVPAFYYSAKAAAMGQISPLILLLIVVAWRLLDRGRDVAGGIILAWLSIKPQLTAILLMGVLIWSVRRGRWGIVWGFASTLVLLGLLLLLVIPNWPVEMVKATRTTRLPTEIFPWFGVTWLSVLRFMGLHGWPLWSCYAAASVPFLAVVIRLAFDRSDRLADLIGLSLIAAFFVSPYGRSYDFPVLLVSACVLSGRRLPKALRAALLLTILLIPYVQVGAMDAFERSIRSQDRRVPEQISFWLPLLLAVTWAGSTNGHLGARSRASNKFDGSGPD